VRLKNYRSIKTCDVRLGRLTFLVGPNGAGKGNFIDALRLVADGLGTSLDHALRDRGGVAEVRRRSGGHPTDFGIRLDFTLSGVAGHFSFEVSARSGGGYVVKREECRLGTATYVVRAGEVARSTMSVAPPAAEDRLYLVNAAGLPEFRPVFDFLSMLGFYNVNPAAIRELQSPDKGDLLARDGSNLASVLERLEKLPDGTKTRIEEYLAKIVPGLEGVGPVRVGHMESLEFRQRVEGAKDPWRFRAINMSDGTLRALAILVAAFQGRGERRQQFVGIEEPEVALHPAAAGCLRDALVDASRDAQILVTSHSPELLDDAAIPADDIIGVTSRDGTSELAPLDEATRSILSDRLYTAGELLRGNQLISDRSQIPGPGQLDMFEDPS
jgi:predicted ATPase